MNFATIKKKACHSQEKKLTGVKKKIKLFKNTVAHSIFF